MTDFHPENHIDEYLSGELAPGEAEAVREYLQSRAGRMGVVVGAYTAAQGLDWGEPPNIEGAKQQFLARLAMPSAHLLRDVPAYPKDRQPGVRSWNRRITSILGVAAAGILIIATPSLWKMFQHSIGDRPAVQFIRTYQTARAQHAVITLPDSSTAVLAPETHMRYVQYANGARMVDLSGQVYFNVVHQESRVFSITTNKVITQVLGTSFDIRRYRTDTATEVAVISGKVAIRGKGSQALLSAGLQGEFSDSSAQVIRTPDSTAVIAWTQGHLMFTNTPVTRMLEQLGRWYGYEFKLSDSTLAARHVTMGVSVDHPKEGLQILSRVLGVTLRMEGTTILLTPRSRTNAETAIPKMRPTVSLSTRMGK